MRRLERFGRFERLGGVAVLAGVLLAAQPALSERPNMKVYKSASCGCCVKWVDHLRENGFSVEVEVAADLGQLKRENGIPHRLGSCHTGFVGGYVVEGHVPASDVMRLLETRPSIVGLAVPGMPIGSPGMEGPNPVPYRVLGDVNVRGANGALTIAPGARPQTTR